MRQHRPAAVCGTAVGCRAVLSMSGSYIYVPTDPDNQLAEGVRFPQAGGNNPCYECKLLCVKCHCEALLHSWSFKRCAEGTCPALPVAPSQIPAAAAPAAAMSGAQDDGLR